MAAPKPPVAAKPAPKPTVAASKPACDPNYSGCVPIASDVDCEGGGGNGPAYVRGPIRVVGKDIYDLDREGNGVACQVAAKPAPKPPVAAKPAPTAEPESPSACDPNYSGCVPVASDVDCAGGSGNGPAYVRGPVRVVGKDIYKLDQNGDGVACE